MSELAGKPLGKKLAPKAPDGSRARWPCALVVMMGVGSAGRLCQAVVTGFTVLQAFNGYFSYWRYPRSGGQGPL